MWFIISRFLDVYKGGLDWGQSKFMKRGDDGAGHGPPCEFIRNQSVREHLNMLKTNIHQRAGAEVRSGRLDKKAPTGRGIICLGSSH